MTPQEETMVSGLVDRVNGTRLPEKDAEAERLLQQRLGSNPDALYILAQTVLVQKYALEQAQAQLQQLRQQPAASEPEHKTSFLGGLFGHREEGSPAQRQSQPVRQYAPSAAPTGGNYPPQQPGYGQQGYAPVQPAGGGGSSFLRSAATTAAGVAAGALAFQGVESLMHGFGHAAGFGGGGGFLGGGGMGMGVPMEENVVNNYYDTPNPNDPSQDFNSAGFDAGPGADRLQDAQDLSQQGSADLSPQLDQASDVSVDDSGGGFDDSQDANLQDTSFDDGGGFEDGGSGDDSSFV